VNIRRAFIVLVISTLCLTTGCRLVTADPHVAFLGDSITEGWRYPRANFGIHGNTTAQMLERFPRAIPGHHFTTIVILGGTNDVLGDTDPNTTIANLEAIGERSAQQNIEPILCEIPPIFHDWRPANTKDYKPKVLELNRRIAALADKHHWKLVDYYTPLANHPKYLSDGVHMTRRGYLVMENALLQKLPLF
jgi:acyl-CoA thioesterase I